MAVSADMRLHYSILKFVPEKTIGMMLERELVMARCATERSGYRRSKSPGVYVSRNEISVREFFYRPFFPVALKALIPFVLICITLRPGKFVNFPGTTDLRPKKFVNFPGTLFCGGKGRLTVKRKAEKERRTYD